MSVSVELQQVQPSEDPYAQYLAMANVQRRLHGDHNGFFQSERHVAFGDGVRVPYSLQSVVPIGAVPVDVTVPGFNGTFGAYQELGTEIAYNGGTSATIKPMRHNGVHSLSRESLTHPETLLPQEVDAVMWDIYNRYGIHVFNLDCHSMGGPGGVKTAEAAAQRSNGPQVAEVRLIESAGVTGHNFFTLACGLPKVGGEAALLSLKHPGVALESIVHFYKNLARTATEMIEVSSCRVSPERLYALGQLGVTVTADFHTKDAFFRADKAQRALGDSVAHFLTGVHGHLAPNLHPKVVADEIKTLGAASLAAAQISRPA